jgi:pimeloyl-ACP methyl ester carboxylesterase
VVLATDWTQHRSDLRQLPLGYVGASTGAAAALIAAADRPDIVRAVVSRGGRPDLAEDALPRVQAPTLLMVGGDDEPVIEMNATMRHYHVRLRSPGATHL